MTVAIALCAMVLVSCAVTVPNATGADFVRDAAEEALWRDAARFERALHEQDVLYVDAELSSYLDEVVAALLPYFGVTRGTIRVHVIETPYANAHALANGGVYVYSGLLAHLESESQLAMLLGHEIAHFVGRHSYLRQRSHEDRTNLAAALGVGVTLLTGGAGVVLVAAAPDILATQYYGHSRELESRADEEALRSMAAAGYDAAAAPRLFELMKLEDEGEIEETYKFGSHPSLDDRVASARRILAEEGAPSSRLDREPGSVERYDRAIAKLLLDNSLLDLKYKRYRRAAAAVDRHLALAPNNARAVFVRGEVARKSGDTDAALRDYAKSVELDPQLAQAHRELGLLYRALDRPVEARRALRAYLLVADDELERAIVEGFLEELEK